MPPSYPVTSAGLALICRRNDGHAYNPANTDPLTSMSQHILTDRSTLAETLHYGVPINRPLPQPTLPFSVDVLEAARERRCAERPDKKTLLAEGARLWQTVCRRTADRASHPILLPLSAGLDSRAILAGLRACDVPVHTVTYGLPGAFDYEIAPRIAERAGASHERIDLEKIELTRSGLIDVARRAERPSVPLDMFFNAQIALRQRQQYSYINGFAGDALSGNNLKTAHGFYWPEATRAFANWHRASKTVKLTADDMDPLDALPGEPFVDPELLPSIEQLDHAIRQQRMVRPIVCPPEVEVFTPFLDPEWCVFMLGLPGPVRENRAFFIELFQYIDPELFALPTTVSGGLPLGTDEAAIRRYRKRLRRRRRIRTYINRLFPAVHVPPADRGWQYLDFRNLLRKDGVLAQLFSNSMARLDEQGVTPWIDAQALLRAHRDHEADHFKALNVLFNLELLLEARPTLFSPESQLNRAQSGTHGSAK